MITQLIFPQGVCMNLYRRLMKQALSILICLSLFASLAVAEAVESIEIIEETQDETFGTTEAGEEDEPIANWSVTITRDQLNVNADLPKDWVNILLIGCDKSANKMGGRSDTLIIASVKDGTVKLTSVARDLYVEIPYMHGLMDRINQAYSIGGAMLAMSTINNLFNLNIQKYVAIDFDGLKAAVDILGGVEVTLQGSEGSYVDKTMQHKTGTFLLDGVQSLRYVRLRSIDNDFGRTERQRKFLTSLISKATENYTNMLASVAELMRYVDTNMPLQEIVRLGTGVAKADELVIKTFCVPAEGSFTYSTIKGKSVITAKIEQNKYALQAFIYNQ